MDSDATGVKVKTCGVRQPRSMKEDRPPSADQSSMRMRPLKCWVFRPKLCTNGRDERRLPVVKLFGHGAPFPRERHSGANRPLRASCSSSSLVSGGQKRRCHETDGLRKCRTKSLSQQSAQSSVPGLPPSTFSDPRMGRYRRQARPQTFSRASLVGVLKSGSTLNVVAGPGRWP